MLIYIGHFFQPKMDTTASSLTISTEPRAMKYKALKMSPWWTRVSPGGACVVRNLIRIFDGFITYKTYYNFRTTYRTLRARKHPGDAPVKGGFDVSNILFKCRHISAWIHSGNCFNTCNLYIHYVSKCMIYKQVSQTVFISMPFVYDQACWKYSSRRFRRGLGIWWNLMNSRNRFISLWYLAVPAYNRCIIAETLPNIIAYINALKYIILFSND